MADKEGTPKAATPAANKPASSTAKPGGTGSVQTEELIQDIRRQMKTSQQTLQRNIDVLTEDARKTREANTAQFEGIANSLAAILSSLKPPGGGTATETVHANSAEQQGGIGRSPPDLSEHSNTSSDRRTPSESSLLSRPQTARKLHDLPTFSGAPEDWPRFIAMFQQSTEAYGYSSLDNCIRLQRCLVGEAKEAVDCLLLDTEATEKVLEALEFRFGRPELLAQAQLRKVREIPPIPEQKAELIVPYASKVANMVAYLDRPKTRHFLVNPELLVQLVLKLPMSRRHEWGRHAVDIQPCATIQDFSAFVNELARAVSFMTPAATIAEVVQSQTATNPRTTGTTATTNRRTMHVSRNEQQQCSVCDKYNHNATDCRRFINMDLNERWTTVRNKRLCFSCLMSGHGTALCEGRVQCGQDGCRMFHHILLHSAIRPQRNQFASGQRADRSGEPTVPAPTTVAAPNAANSAPERVQNCLTADSDAVVLCRIIPVQLYGSTMTIQTFALFDEGSTVSMIDEEMAKQLGLTGPSQALGLQFIGGRHVTEMSRTVNLRIGGVNAARKFDLTNVQTYGQLDLPKQSLCMAELSRKFPQLRGLPVADYTDAKATILIGVDYINLGVALRQVSCSSAGPVATKTRLGWVIGGPRRPPTVGETVHSRKMSRTNVQGEIQKIVQEYSGLEHFGVRHIERPPKSRDDQRAREILRRTTKPIVGRYETGLLWKTDVVKFPESSEMATKRLLSVKRRMMRDATFAARYRAIIDDYVAKGIARHLFSTEAACVDKRMWNLPHFAVTNPNKPAKIRVVYSEAAVNGVDCLLSNFTIYAKLLLQKFCQHGTGWDDPIPMKLHDRWRQVVTKLDVCRQVQVPRCYAAGIATKRVQLHVFADASQSAYAIVAYWRVEIAQSQWILSFVAGKSRVVPPKLISVPRLELQAAILAVRLRNSIRSLHTFEIERTVFWSESKTVVQWVRSNRLQSRPFVAHRISEILEETTVKEWRWVPTLHNAADDATRANYPIRFEAENRWISGPDFLMQPEEEWPAEPANMSCSDGAEEVRPFSAQMVCTNLASVPIVRITRFGDLYRACRSMALVLRCITNLRTKKTTKGELQPEELEAAERHLVKAAQADAFPAELQAPRKKAAIPKSSAIRSLLPHLDVHGVLRMTGRIDKAVHMPEDARNPVILPKDHHFTTILVTTYHRRMRHQLQAAVIGEIRLKYWIPHLRAVVRRVKSACMLCRLKSARAIEPVMGQLPADRLTPFVRAFTFTGVDYFGPLFVTIGRRREKRWVALFTCLTTRAVHLELAADLSTDACIICLRNFVNLRGVPKIIRSDNGTNFVGASRELRDAVDMFDHAAIQRELGQHKIKWQFNCPGHPQAGGCWERLVQSVKRVLSVTLKEIAPQVETLRSLLIEAANIVNMRPLTHLPVQGDEDEPLTPNHFLLGTSNSTQTPGPDDPRMLCMRKQFRIAQALKNTFWKRWILEYLPDLTRRAKGYDDFPPMEIGALVLICDPLLPRGQWRRGRVVAVYPGPDGRVRTASMRTADGELKRPVSKLVVLRIDG